MSREFLKNPEPKITPPTVGRIVHVFGSWEPGVGSSVPRAAIVAGVVDDLTINAALFNFRGDLAAVQNIPHKSTVYGEVSMWWDWMDFQKGQAAKTEQLEARLKDAAYKPSPDDGR